MTGSENQPKTSKNEELQLPLKGFHVEVKNPKNGRKQRIEGMGDGRFRVHVTKAR